LTFKGTFFLYFDTMLDSSIPNTLELLLFCLFIEIGPYSPLGNVKVVPWSILFAFEASGTKELFVD